MSVAEPAPGGAAGGKQDPVVPDAVVYLCSVVIVVMVVGGVIGLSILMKQRLDVNQNVTTAAPAGPGAPPPKARLVSVEDSESSDFKVFNDDDPFHYRVAKARDKKVPTTRVTKAKRKTTKRAKATTKHKSRRLPVTHGVKTTAKHGKRKTNVAHNRDLEKDKTVKAATEATAIREIGALENISDVGVAGIEIKAKKNAAKNARNDTIGGDVDKGDVQVSAKKKVSAKERKRQAVVETMKVFLKSSSEAQPPNITINKSPPAPDSVNLSDVSASEAASGDDGVAEHKTIAIKLIKPAEIEKTSEVDNVASHNQSARAAVSGSSVNGTASNTSSLGNAPVTNESSDKAAPVISSRGNTSDGNTLVGNTVLTNSSSSVNKNSASHVRLRSRTKPLKRNILTNQKMRLSTVRELRLLRHSVRNSAQQLHLASVVRPGWPHVSLMATLGGGGEKNDIAMAKAFEAGDATLDALATEAANLVRKRGLDGLNVHWTVPDLEGDVEAYAVGLVAFIKKLRKELGPSSIITVVLPSEPEERNAAFNVRELQPLVNFLFVSTHDTFSPYSTLTHFNGPAQDIDTGGMFTAIADVMKQLNANQSRQLCFTFGLSGVAYKVDAGAPLAKYVPLVGAVEPSIAQSAPNAGQLPKEGQPITYDELNLTCHRAHVEKSCYDKVGDTWYGYVDEEAVASKAKWILKDGWENLCVVAWNVDADDVKGSCRGDAAASYPLLRSLSQATAALAY
ncbi:hypothetical protein HPB49_023939 [Dermacentor silvarum]|uniref:Uncharacterized protein n=1 Tax=Dermacentor silvarum TaxID=543639 RepID=A0ACB8DGN4_DERSI|nr:hypothetical protein HPB49_023939 [Dermacentor silvarum]